MAAKNPRISKLKQCGKMPGCFAEFTLSEANGLSMTDPKVVLLGPWRRKAGMEPSEARVWGVEFGGGGIDAGRLCR